MPIYYYISGSNIAVLVLFLKYHSSVLLYNHLTLTVNLRFHWMHIRCLMAPVWCCSVVHHPAL